MRSLLGQEEEQPRSGNGYNHPGDDVFANTMFQDVDEMTLKAVLRQEARRGTCDVGEVARITQRLGVLTGLDIDGPRGIRLLSLFDYRGHGVPGLAVQKRIGHSVKAQLQSQEVAVALAVLCRSTTMDRIRIMFAAFDREGTLL